MVRRYLPKLPNQIARGHCSEELALEREMRLHPEWDGSGATSMDRARPCRIATLTRIAAGDASTEEMDAHVGSAIDEYRRRGKASPPARLMIARMLRASSEAA